MHFHQQYWQLPATTAPKAYGVAQTCKQAQATTSTSRQAWPQDQQALGLSAGTKDHMHGLAAVSIMSHAQQRQIRIRPCATGAQPCELEQHSRPAQSYVSQEASGILPRPVACYWLSIPCCAIASTLYMQHPSVCLVCCTLQASQHSSWWDKCSSQTSSMQPTIA
jgi:hypothetical protein